jgi:HAD superfamily hydrolase (TIGR01509 family)
MNKEDVKGIIFDLDGVLFDSEYYQWQGWAEPLKGFGVELTKEMYFKYAGKSWRPIGEEMIKDFNLNISVEELWEKKKKLLEKWFNEKAMPIMPYAREAVEYFSSNPNLKVGLCSGGDKEEIITKLEKNNFVKYFAAITAGSDVIKSKPEPDIYLLAAERLGLKPEECLAFEDTQYGLQAAKAAGVYCFAVPNEYSEKQDFSKADKVISSLKEAIEFFNN